MAAIFSPSNFNIEVKITQSTSSSEPHTYMSARASPVEQQTYINMYVYWLLLRVSDINTLASHTHHKHTNKV